MKLKNFIPFFLFFLILIVPTLAQPPFQQSESTTGYQLETPILEYHRFNESFDFHVHVYNFSNGYPIYPNEYDNVTCELHLYDSLNGSHLYVADMEVDLIHDSEEWHHTIPAENFIELRDYSIVIYCKSNSEDVKFGGFFEYGFEVTEDGKIKDKSGGALIAIIVLIPLIFGLFMMIGAATLGQEHAVLRIFLFLFSPIMTWAAAHFAMIGVVRYYGLTELQEVLGDFTYYTAIIFFVLLSYFIIYTIWKWADTIAQKKDKETRLEY